MKAYFASILATSCYAVLAPMAKKALPFMPPFLFITITMLLLSVISAIASTIFEKNFSLTSLTSVNWIGIGVFSSINFAAYAIYLYAISKIPITHYQLIGLLAPIIGGVMAFLVLGEPIKPQYFLGLIFIGFGLFVALKNWS